MTPYVSFRIGFQFRQLVDDRHLALLAFDEIRDQVHRAGAIERDDGDDVFEPVRFEAGQQVAHAGAFQLENPGGLSGGEQGKGLGVVEGQLIHASTAAGRDALSLIRVSARWIIVRVLRPRKSNFTSPIFSTSPIEYWVTISSLAPL